MLPSHVLPFFPFPPARRRGEGHGTEPSCAGSFHRTLPCSPHFSSSSSSSSACRRAAKQAGRIPRSLRSPSQGLKVTGGTHLRPGPPRGMFCTRAQQRHGGGDACVRPSCRGALTGGWQQEGQGCASRGQERGWGPLSGPQGAAWLGSTGLHPRKELDALSSISSTMGCLS